MIYRTFQDIRLSNLGFGAMRLPLLDGEDEKIDEEQTFRMIDAELRGRGLQYNKDVYIGENAWIGACAVIVPGVRIGKNTVIGAGSVVTKDIPDNVVAVGYPCRVLREVSEHDRVFFYKDERIDWENL